MGAEKRFPVSLEAMTEMESWTKTDNKVHFVDLAGSEQLNNTGVHREGTNECVSMDVNMVRGFCKWLKTTLEAADVLCVIVMI